MMPLDRNESYWLLDTHLENVARASLGSKEYSTYPEYEALTQSLATYAGVDVGRVLPTPGSDAAIEHVARMCAEEGKEILLPVPTFYGYESILARVGARVTPLFYTEREGVFVFPLEETIVALKSGPAKALFLCEPNNPLGCALSVQEFSQLIAAARNSGATLVSDEAYFEFSFGQSLVPFLGDLPDAIVIRTLSKSFGLSGLRVGYIIAAQHIVKKIRTRLLPWPIAHPSVVAAVALLAHADEVRARRALVIAERDACITALRTISNITAYPSQTNFVLARVPHAEQLRAKLFEQGIRVAIGESMTQFPEAKSLLKDTLRIAIPAPESKAIFLNSVRRVPQ